MHITNQDNYGWYEVGPNRYYNKIEAILEHNRARQPIRWNYNDHVYDQYQWDQEPEQSIEDLYAARAWNIRNQYDYLILHFSGGTDSGNILETFIKNGIHLDEVLIRGSFDQTNKETGRISSTNQYAECLTQAIPLAQWAKDNHYPSLKISLVNTTEVIIDYFKNNPDWVNHDLSSLSPGQAFRTKLNQLCPHYTELVEKGKRVCHIYGADKPQIYRENNIFYTRWLDEVVRPYYLAWQTQPDMPYYVEMFYWAPDAVLLQIKQLHMIKNYIKRHVISEQVLSQLSGRDHENFIASIIYNRTLPIITEHLKDSGTSIIKDRDAWFGRYQNNDAYTTWKKGVHYLSDLLPKQWQNNSDLATHGIRGLWSKPRYLGT